MLHFPKTRRELLRALAALPLVSASACASDPGTGTGSTPTPPPQPVVPPPGADAASPVAAVDGAAPITLTPTCGSLTEASIEGPYFLANSPERSSLLAGTPSDAPRMTLRGIVRTAKCEPIAGALVELWQADEMGVYDGDGFHLRGHVFTDAKGEYAFETVVPGLYRGRTRHLHVKVQPKGAAILTTQLYFPNDPGNVADSFFLPSLVMQLGTTAANAPIEATFDFVV